MSALFFVVENFEMLFNSCDLNQTSMTISLLSQQNIVTFNRGREEKKILIVCNIAVIPKVKKFLR